MLSKSSTVKEHDRLFKFCTWSCLTARGSTSPVVGSCAAAQFPTRSTRFSGLVPRFLRGLRVTPAGQNAKRHCSRDRGGSSHCWSCVFRLPRWRSWSLWRWSWGGWRTFQSPSSTTLPTWRGERKRCGTPTVNTSSHSRWLLLQERRSEFPHKLMVPCKML